MGKAKGKNKGKAKGKSAARPPIKELANARKIGQRDETITVTLSPMEVDHEREIVVQTLREIDSAEEKRKNEAAAAKAKISDLKTKLIGHVRVASTAKRDVEIVIEEWLTEANEVVRVRQDTGSIVGSRTARVDELQEELFAAEGGGEDDEDDDGEDEEPGFGGDDNGTVQ